MPSLTDLLNLLWQDYVRMNPQASAIHNLLAARGEKIVNDHIAFRTFDDPRVNIQVIARPFLSLGYKPVDEYDFPDKKLNALHFEHPGADSPRIFISELRVGDFSPSLRKTIGGLLDQLPNGATDRWDFSASGRPWNPVTYAAYQALLAESEYAAWMTAFGYRANHFTIFINALKGFAGLREFNEFIKSQGFPLNTSGGEIKGSPADYLEQSSTLAPPVQTQFADGMRAIPGCYYEFARRFPLPGGKLFSGFVAKSADKIFESTNVKR